MKSFFIRNTNVFLKAAITLGLDFSLDLEYPNQLFLILNERKKLWIPENRWVVVEDAFVAVITDQEYKMLN
ncbi:hypothetical protein [Acinetobacter bereziniae]|uniref:hypothetical protein n=1 Tax=Acinetobacter bereziniae TaxID=106648 RepID=UPI0012501670|nr:hypothetical protein [Acinetobacter bereziniae]